MAFLQDSSKKVTSQHLTREEESKEIAKTTSGDSSAADHTISLITDPDESDDGKSGLPICKNGKTPLSGSGNSEVGNDLKKDTALKIDLKPWPIKTTDKKHPKTTDKKLSTDEELLFEFADGSYDMSDNNSQDVDSGLSSKNNRVHGVGSSNSEFENNFDEDEEARQIHIGALIRNAVDYQTSRITFDNAFGKFEEELKNFINSIENEINIKNYINNIQQKLSLLIDGKKDLDGRYNTVLAVFLQLFKKLDNITPELHCALPVANITKLLRCNNQSIPSNREVDATMDYLLNSILATVRGRHTPLNAEEDGVERTLLGTDNPVDLDDNSKMLLIDRQTFCLDEDEKSKNLDFSVDYTPERVCGVENSATNRVDDEHFFQTVVEGKLENVRLHYSSTVASLRSEIRYLQNEVLRMHMKTSPDLEELAARIDAAPFAPSGCIKKKTFTTARRYDDLRRGSWFYRINRAGILKKIHIRRRYIWISADFRLLYVSPSAPFQLQDDPEITEGNTSQRNISIIVVPLSKITRIEFGDVSRIARNFRQQGFPIFPPHLCFTIYSICTKPIDLIGVNELDVELWAFGLEGLIPYNEQKPSYSYREFKLKQEYLKMEYSQYGSIEEALSTIFAVAHPIKTCNNLDLLQDNVSQTDLKKTAKYPNKEHKKKSGKGQSTVDSFNSTSNLDESPASRSKGTSTSKNFIYSFLRWKTNDNARKTGSTQFSDKEDTNKNTIFSEKNAVENITIYSNETENESSKNYDKSQTQEANSSINRENIFDNID